MYPEYKAHWPPCPVDLALQFDLVKETADAYGIPRVEMTGHKVNNVITMLTTMAVESGWSEEVLTGNKDLMHLMREE